MTKQLMGLRHSFLCMVAMLCFGAVAVADSGRSDVRECQILDKTEAAGFQMSVAHTPAAALDDGEDLSMLDTRADWRFGSHRARNAGEFDLNLRLRMLLLMEDSPVVIPDQLVMLAVDTGWTFVSKGGVGFQLRVKPGIYSDFQSADPDILFVPFSLALTQNFNSSLSAIVGAELRPEFSQFLMPLVGVAWEIDRIWRLEAMLPESRLVCFASRNVNTAIGLGWESASFRMSDDNDTNADLLTTEDLRLFWSLGVRAGSVELVGRLGMAFSRELVFSHGDDDTRMDLDSKTYYQVGLAGPF